MDRDLAGFSSRWLSLITDLRDRLRESLAQPGADSFRHLRVSVDADGLDPLQIAVAWPGAAPSMFWARPDRSFSFMAIGSAAEVRATGERRFEEVSAGIERFSQGVLSLNLSGLADADLPFMTGGYSFGPFNISPEWREFGSSRFETPRWICTRLAGKSALTVTIPMDRVDGADRSEKAIQEIDEALQRFSTIHHGSKCDKPGTTQGERSMGTAATVSGGTLDRLVGDEPARISWMSNVERAVELIRGRAFQKIVLARELRMPIQSEPSDLAVRMLGQLIESFPDCSIFLKRTAAGASFIGASPERLMHVDRGVLTTDALAGSISRGLDEEEDRRLASKLMSNGKDHLEHDYVVRQITRTLEGLASQIQHPESPAIRKLRNLQHLHTPITAMVDPGVQLHRILKELHPTPAVGGYPREKAVPHIQELEQIHRGWYSGIVGWQGFGQDGDFAVAIRAALLSGSTARLYAGCGIVESSDPRQEWEESCLKVAPLADALEAALREST